MLEVEQPEDSDTIADSRFGIKPYHDALCPLRTSFAKIPVVAKEDMESYQAMALPVIPNGLKVQIKPSTKPDIEYVTIE